MDDMALDIGLRQGLIDEDIDASFVADEDEDEEIDEETEESGDDFGGDPDVVNDQIQAEFEALIEEIQDAESAIENSRALYNLAVDTYVERREHLLTWMDEHIEEGDIPAWAGEFEDLDA